DVGIARVELDPRDLLRLLETHRRPRLTAVGGLPHAVAVRDVAADGILATADPHDIRILLIDGERADRAAEIVVGDGRRGLAAIDRLPDTAARGAEVVLIGASVGARDGDHAAGRVGADVA